MTNFEILQKVINTFNLNNRCSQKDSCKYSGDSVDHESPGCAIGMFLPKEVANLADSLDVGDVAQLLDCQEVWDKLESMGKDKEVGKWLHEDNITFLDALQNLHDVNAYWSENGLSEYGKRRVQGFYFNLGIDDV